MSFDRRDIRPQMDVYTRDNVYLGVVLRIRPGPAPLINSSNGINRTEGSTVSGELLGPMPTQTIGNAGPLTQAARAAYASAPDPAAVLGQGMLIVGKWYGLIGRRRIPLDAVQTVSLERVVLRLTFDQL